MQSELGGRSRVGALVAFRPRRIDRDTFVLRLYEAPVTTLVLSD